MSDYIKNTAIPLFIFALFWLLCAPTFAQEVLVRNGATFEVTNRGVVDLRGATMDFGAAGATARLDEESAGRVTGGTLTAIRTLNGPSSADPAGLGAILTAGANLGEVTVTRGHTVQTGGGNQSIERYYDLSPSQNNGGLSATLTFTYHDAERSGLAESNLELFTSTDGGTNWSQEGADSRTTSPTGGNTVTLGGIGSFSRWTLGSAASPLPVELASFEGTRTEAGVQLTWETATEQNNAGFRIQRMDSGATMHRGADQSRAWTDVGFVEGSGTTSDAQSYRFTDDDLPYVADSVAYRLKQVDTDGTTHVTEPVTLARGAPERLGLLGTAPNPARNRATVRFAIPEGIGGGVTLRLYDVMGRQVRSLEARAEAGRHEQTLRVVDLSSGVYFLRLRAGSSVETQKLTVVR